MRIKRLKYEKGASAKFWQIQVKGKRTIVTYGKVGSDGRVLEKSFASEKLAKNEASKLVAQKMKKGYKTVKNKTLRKQITAPKHVATCAEIKAGDIVDAVGLVGHLEADRYYLGRTAGIAFTFLHWKLTKGKMIEGSFPIVLKQSLIGRKYANAIKRFQPYTIFRLKLRIENHPKQEKLIGVIRKDYGKTDDGELKKLAQAYPKHILIKDSDIGNFKLVRDSRRFECGNARWMSRRISVDIAVNDLAEYCPIAMRLLKRIFKKPDSWEKKVKNYAAKEMIENARNWQQQEHDSQTIDSGEKTKPKKPITMSEFKERITLMSISASSDSIVFWLDDDDIFYSHVIEVGLTLDGKFDCSSIAG